MKWGFLIVLFFSVQSYAYRGGICAGMFESISQPYKEKTFVTKEKSNVYYLDYNEGAATTVVLLHGVGESAESMDVLAQYFSLGYHVISIDMIGHGRGLQEIPDDIHAIDYRKNVENIRQFLDSKDLGNFVMVGHSYGGGIAFEVTKVLSQKPTQVILMAPYTQRLDKDLYDSINAGFIFAPGVGDAVEDSLTTPWMHSHYEERFLNQWGKKLSDLTDDERTLLEKKIDMAMATARGILQLDLLNKSRDLNWDNNIPVTILGGANDSFVPASQLQAFAKRLSNGPVQLIFIPDVGHDFPLKNAANTYQIIAKILSFRKTP